MNREERIAQNGVLFRHLNERILEIEAHRWRLGPVDFMCECGDEACTRSMRLGLADYERLRSDSTDFGVLPGHELHDVEEVVETHPHYLVVEKRPPVQQRAIETDPRA